MTNPFYTTTGAPVTSSPLASAVQRSEFSLIQSAFDKLPALTAGTAIVVNPGGTALSNTVGKLLLAGDLTTTGAFATILAASAAITLTLPGASGTLATLAGTEELTNKTLTASVGKGVWTASGTWTLPAITVGGALTYGGVTLTNAVIGTGNMVLSISPTITGTLTATGLVDISGAGAGQIKFPAAQNASANANTIDDYKEGTWVPNDQSGAALTFTVTDATYIKIGQIVVASARITYPATADGSTASIGGLPYTSRNSTNSIFGGSPSFTDTNFFFSILVAKNDTRFAMIGVDGVSKTNVNMSTHTLDFSIVYFAVN